MTDPGSTPTGPAGTWSERSVPSLSLSVCGPHRCSGTCGVLVSTRSPRTGSDSPILEIASLKSSGKSQRTKVCPTARRTEFLGGFFLTQVSDSAFMRTVAAATDQQFVFRDLDSHKVTVTGTAWRTHRVRRWRIEEIEERSASKSIKSVNS
jgi:hypothetical protein